MWLFDLFDLDDRDLARMPLDERRARLARLAARLPRGSVFKLSESFDDPQQLLDVAQAMGLEGVVSKRRDAHYRSGRWSKWVKVKTESWRRDNRERWRLFERRARHA